jgi:LmbE family N-acetylglucosaminyl deacetylase
MRVLAIGVTTWDIITYCGGTIALCAAGGDEVTIAPLLATRSDSQPAVAERSAAAVAVLGAEIVGQGTGSLEDTRANRDQLMDVIRRVDPAVLISASPSSRSAIERAAAALTFNAAYPACVPNYPSPGGLAAVTVRAPILHMDAIALADEEGLTYVDIGPTWPQKEQALQEFSASNGELPTAAPQARWRAEVLSRARGIQVQTTWAEAFGQAQVWGRLATRRLVPQ